MKDLLDSTNSTKQFDHKYEPTQVQVQSFDEVLHLFKKSESNRTVASTACNERSSRSHSILQIQLPIFDKMTTLSLIDLAGSERLDKTKVEGQRLKETQAINKSLSALADVISAMKEKEGHVPYRNSKLTFVL